MQDSTLQEFAAQFGHLQAHALMVDQVLQRYAAA
jgi:hypothetical protein